MKYAVVTFYPDNKKVVVPVGTDILTAAIKSNIFLSSSCGGKGICGRCKVKILSGEFSFEPTGKISEEEKNKNIYLACRTFVKGNIVVEILPSVRLPEKKFIEPFEKGEKTELGEIPLEKFHPISPLTHKYFLRISPPTLNDNMSDLERIYRDLEKLNLNSPIITLQDLRKLPELLRESNWEITVTVGKINGKNEIILIEPGDTSKNNYGIAVDIGTTTITASLINLNNGESLRTEVSFNRQITYGEDIITRIIYAEKPDGLEQLHHIVVEVINQLIQSIVLNSSINLNDVTCIVCSGNTTMMHLLFKVNPSFLRKEPYTPSANFFPDIKASEVGIKINPSGILSSVGGISSYVGGDITAGVLISEIYKKEKLQILIDIGTNGEIVLGNKEWLVCCSASAGPAFEGSGVKDGMRAVPGAIQSFEIKSDVKIKTIDEKLPLGICGSGYIEIISELFKNGIIDRSGKFIVSKKFNRIRESSEGKEFVICFQKETGYEKDIVITQIDIENLLRAKAAIFAGLSTLIKKSGVDWNEIEKIYIGGGFGNYLNIKKAISIGLLPDLPVKKFKFMGNTSLLGTKMFLLSKQAREDSNKIVKKMTYLELSLEPEYMEEYLSALFIPHTNLNLFPSVKKI